MKGICHKRSRGRHFSPSMPGDRYLKLGSQKRSPGRNLSGNIVRYDALAPRPEVLLYWYFVCACAVSLEAKFLPYSWGKYWDRFNWIEDVVNVIYSCQFLEKVDQTFSALFKLLTKIDQRKNGERWSFTIFPRHAKDNSKKHGKLKKMTRYWKMAKLAILQRL